MNAISLNRNTRILLVTSALLLGIGAMIVFAALSAGAADVTKGNAYVGYHCNGDVYGSEAIAVAKADYRTNPLELEVHNWTLTALDNNWGNVITQTVAGNNVSFAFAAKVATSFNNQYVGPSANMRFVATVSSIGSGGANECEYGKIGFFTAPTVLSTTATYNQNVFTNFADGGEFLAQIVDGNATSVTLNNLVDGSEITAYFTDDRISLGTCTVASGSCSFNAPTNTTFKEWGNGWKYLHLVVKGAGGVVLATPTPAPTATP
jgi:hypothetical protein